MTESKDNLQGRQSQEGMCNVHSCHDEDNHIRAIVPADKKSRGLKSAAESNSLAPDRLMPWVQEPQVQSCTTLNGQIGS